MRSTLGVVLTVTLLPLAVARASAAPAAAAVWTVLGSEGRVVVRTTTTATSCPGVRVGGKERRMRQRVAPNAAFATRVCEATLPAGATSADVSGTHVVVPAGPLHRIAVLGDSGCHVEQAPFQNCADAEAWPARRIAERLVAAKPDLIIHTGDYLYRMRDCALPNAGCVGPWGDNWAAWSADFIGPFKAALAAAPWIFTRGNHELCGAGGEGWRRLLDPRPYTSSCENFSAPYAVDVGDRRFIVLDSAAAKDPSAPPDLVRRYATQLATVRHLAAERGDAWLLSHRPVWVLGKERYPPPDEFEANRTLQVASGNDLGPSISLVLSGHVHLLSYFAFANGRPPQLVVGTGGTRLDEPLARSFAERRIAGATVSSGGAIAAHGFLLLQRDGAAWDALFYRVDGTISPRCRLSADKQISCID